MKVPRTRSTGIVLALVTATVSGVSVFVNSYAVKAWGNATAYTTAKNLLAALALGALLAVATARRSAAGFTRPATTGQWLGLAAVGLIGGAVPFVLFFEGLAHTTAKDAAFLQKTLVAWVAVGAVVFLKERIGWPHLVAIAALVVGQALLGVKLTSLRPGSGEAMILAATLLWSAETIVAKRLLGSLSPLTVGVARMGLGSVLLVAWAAVTGSAAAIVPTSASAWGWVLLTGVLLTAYVTGWLAALSRAQAVDVTAVLVGGAVLTAVLDAAFRDQALLPNLAGLGLVAAGVAVMALLPPPARRAGDGLAPAAAVASDGGRP